MRPAPSLQNTTQALLLAAVIGAVPSAHGQNIQCSAKECRGTDIMGNPVLLRVESERLDPTQRYTVHLGGSEIQIERKRAPILSADWDGPALMQRPITTVTGSANGQPINLYTESSGLTTGQAFGQPINCSVNGWSVFPTPCF
jgi:hypothetical protein